MFTLPVTFLDVGVLHTSNVDVLPWVLCQHVMSQLLISMSECGNGK